MNTTTKRTLTRAEAVRVLRRVGRQTKRVPTRDDVLHRTGLQPHAFTAIFGGWRRALTCAGFKARTQGVRRTREQALTDWGRVTRALGHPPALLEQRKHGACSPATILRHVGKWRCVAEAFIEFARRKREWADVLPLAQAHARSMHRQPRGRLRAPPGPGCSRWLAGRPVAGGPLHYRALAYEPDNEQGVVLLFGMVAHELGYYVEKVRTRFPDCEAIRRVREGVWQRVRIEFEFASRHFPQHRHRADQCDVIVCWKHNWAACPRHIDVVELSSVIGARRR